METLYTLLAKLGYDHPLHAPLTHVPIGMVVGTFLFSLAARVTRNASFTSTAHHCATLGFISVFPTALLGYLDWHHFYAGASLPQVEKKLLLAALLAVTLAATVIVSRKAPRFRAFCTILACLNLILAGGLGYLGGELAFKSLTRPGSVDSLTLQKGGEIYRQMCTACHPKGGNALKPSLPLLGAPQLQTVDLFVDYIRSPRARDGSSTVMPAFSEEKLSRQQADALYQYVSKGLSDAGN